MKRNQRTYDPEYKVQVVKLAQEIGSAAAAKGLGISRNTIYTWVRCVKSGDLDIGNGAHNPAGALTLNEELIQARKLIKDQEKEINRLKKENAFLEEASAFFAASQRFFRSEPSEVSKNIRMKFIAIKTDDGRIKGDISFYCHMLKVSREGFRKFLKNKVSVKV